MTYNYTDAQKAAIKANPLSRENCRSIRIITTWKYREYQKAEKALASLAKNTPEKQRKAIADNFAKTKDEYETALCKFKLYKELFPDIVQ